MDDGSLGDEDLPQIEYDQLWQQALEQLWMEMPPAAFDTWLRRTRLVARGDTRFVIAVPTQYAADWLTHRMQGAIKRTLASLAKVRSCTLVFEVGALQIT